MSRKGASYFLTFTDDFSLYGYVYLLKHKHEVFETFKVFIFLNIYKQNPSPSRSIKIQFLLFGVVLTGVLKKTKLSLISYFAHVTLLSFLIEEEV